MPFIRGLVATTKKLFSKGLSKLTAPFSDRFIENLKATKRHHFLNISEAEGECVIEPDTVEDDLGREAISLVRNARRRCLA